MRLQVAKVGVLILDKQIRSRQVTKGAAFDDIKHIGFREIINDCISAGHDIEYVSPRNAHGCDFVLFSVVSYYEAYNIMNTAPLFHPSISDKLILGGAGLSNAIPFRDFTHAACFGRGETLAPKIISGEKLSNVWTMEDYNFSGKYEIGQMKKWVAIEDFHGEKPKGLSDFQESHLGCRKKCYFCQYTWKNQFTKDDSRIGYKSGLNDCENTIAEIDWSRDGSRANHNITAIDGATERARRTVNRANITNLKIIETLYRFFEQTSHDVATLKLYCVVGYPFETEKDVNFQELMNLFKEVDKSLPVGEKKKLHIFITCTHFVPMPFTPMQGEPVNTFNVREYLHRHKPQYVGKNIVAKIMSQVTSPAAAMEQAVYNRVKIGDEKYMKALTSKVYNKLDVSGRIAFMKKHIPERMWGATDSKIHDYIQGPYELENVVKAYQKEVKTHFPEYAKKRGW